MNRAVMKVFDYIMSLGDRCAWGWRTNIHGMRNLWLEQAKVFAPYVPKAKYIHHSIKLRYIRHRDRKQQPIIQELLTQ